MGDVQLTADAAVDLADLSHSPIVQLVLLSAERADATGVAKFDRGELAELLGVHSSMPHSVRNRLHRLVGLGRRGGWFMDGSTPTRITLNADMVRPLGFGLRVVHKIDGRRVVAECSTCRDRTTFVRERVEDDTARCPRCKA